MSTTRRGGSRWAALLACALALGPPAQAIDAGTAHGELTAHGSRLSLAHATALRYTDRAGLGPSVGGGAELRIVLADAALTATALDGPGRQRLRAQARLTPLRGVLLLMPAEARGAVTTGTVSLLSDIAADPPHTEPLAGVQLAFGDQRVLGVIDFTSADGSLRVLARFSAPLFHDLPPTLDLHGERARDSPQAAVLIEYEQALRQGAFAHARQLATPSLQTTLADLEQQDEGTIEVLVAGLSAPAVRRRAVQRLVVVPPYAYLVLAPGHAAPVVMHEAQGRWQVDAP